MRLGGSGTTDAIYRITRSLAVHQDIYSLRCWLQFEHGYDEADTHEAVKRIDLGANESSRQIKRYVLRDDVRALHRRLRQADRTSPALAGDPHPSPTRPSSRRGEACLARQSVLFQTQDALSRARKAERTGR